MSCLLSVEHSLLVLLHLAVGGTEELLLELTHGGVANQIEDAHEATKQHAPEHTEVDVYEVIPQESAVCEDEQDHHRAYVLAQHDQTDPHHFHDDDRDLGQVAPRVEPATLAL